MDSATALTTSEQALRDLLNAVMTKEHGPAWMDTVVSPEDRQRWQEIRAQEERQRDGHTLTGVTDLSYAFLGDLVDMIKKKGHWDRLFKPVFGDKNEVFAYFNLLQRVRRPADHARPLLPFEEDLASGIAGYIRNKVTIYLSDQDPDNEYYPRVESIEDSIGNSYSLAPGTNLADPQSVMTNTTLSVGDVVTFRCRGTDPHGRLISWALAQNGGTDTHRLDGDNVDLVWNVTPADTGPRKPALIMMGHDGPYHRNVGLNSGADAVVIFYYRVVPPRA